MDNNDTAPVLEHSKGLLLELIRATDLPGAQVTVLARPLTPEEAIGTPGRRDFPIIEGKERIVEAFVNGARGQAFTDTPVEFIGSLDDLLCLPLETNQNRALFIAALNALLRHVGRIGETLHCRDDDPEKCGREIASILTQSYGTATVGLIGFNPAIAENLVTAFGPERVCITDMNPNTIGSLHFEVTVWDGKTMTEELVGRSAVVLITGTTLVNGTFDAVLGLVRQRGREYLIYGVTAVGVAHLVNLNHICPYSRKE